MTQPVPIPTAAARLERIEKRLEQALKHAQEEGVSSYDEVVDAATVRITLASIQALRQDIIMGAEYVPEEIRNGAITMSFIAETTARNFELPLQTLLSERRSRGVVTKATKAVAHLARKHTHRSYPQIATFLKKRDHTTVIHAVKSARTLLRTDPDFAEIVHKIEREVLTHA